VLRSALLEWAHQALYHKMQLCGGWRRDFRLLPGRSRKGHHAAPELGPAAYVDVVFSYEVELAVAADTEHGKPSGQRLKLSAVAHQQRLDAGRNQHASGRIDSEGAQLDSASVGVLDQRRLASRLINGPDRDAILAASRHFLAVNCHSRGLAVRLI